MPEQNNLQQRMEEAYALYADGLYEYCRQKLEGGQGAEDIVQEAFLRAWEYMHAGNTLMPVKIVLYRAANYLLADEGRRRRLRQDVSLESLPEGDVDTIVDQLEREQKLLDVRIMLTRFRKKKEYDLLIMRYVDGLQPAEIASVTGLAPGTVAVRIHRALKKLAQRVVMKQRD